ncbi:MAG: hypothetical protein ACRDTC_28050 [Pseudonocardiaceae bacterium]
MAEFRRNRRDVLTAGVAVATLLVAGSTALAGCTSSVPPVLDEPDPLESPAQRAESDVALAQAVASMHLTLTAPAAALAADRQAHATALRAELRRAQPSPPPTSAAAASASPAPVSTATDQAVARDALAAAVWAAQEEAVGLVAVLPGYRAALLASVAACCASHAALLA